ncbi:hypothetical protein [Achromobacter sp. PAB15]|uniref:hypothetical protein n=1 Tax=Achromobacter sp. PAB15 TaxID=3233048 RepID=UPI003F906194
MSNKSTEMQRFIRHYKEATGEKEVDMHKVAEFAAQTGWPLPKPRTALDRLAEQFSQAARQETRRDPKTGRPYRANHALQQWHGKTQLTLWIDIDEAPRGPMLKSLINRREQMVGDGLQLTLDADHWNSIHTDEEPIAIPLDFTDDVAWRKNAPDEDEKAA